MGGNLHAVNAVGVLHVPFWYMGLLDSNVSEVLLLASWLELVKGETCDMFFRLT